MNININIEDRFAETAALSGGQGGWCPEFGCQFQADPRHIPTRCARKLWKELLSQKCFKNASLEGPGAPKKGSRRAKKRPREAKKAI